MGFSVRSTTTISGMDVMRIKGRRRSGNCGNGLARKRVFSYLSQKELLLIRDRKICWSLSGVRISPHLLRIGRADAVAVAAHGNG